ncbi:MAG: PH domain-containing protein, partial [Gemmatimonadota bacterium]|nr:PH domain-containing protein [Gemmatimonadota bacterium]
MDLVEPIPERLLPHIRGELQPGELLIVLLAADIRPDGQYGDSWFALTDERMLVFHPNGADKPDTVRLGLDEVQGIQTRNYVGSGALVVELEDETVELLRFSQSAYYKFSGVPQAIEG